ncbi:MAG: hypothetical protein ACE5FI_17390, partial [Anaerolineales bacterium]
MAKRKKQQQAVRLTRKQVRMSRREQQLRRSIIGATVFVAALVIALVGYGLLDQFVLVQRRPVARVGETEITYAQLDKAVRFRRVQLLNQYGPLLQLSRLGVGQQV